MDKDRGYYNWENSYEAFAEGPDCFQIYNGNIDPDNVYSGFNREAYDPPLSGGLQEGLERHYAGPGLVPKLRYDEYGILWSITDLYVFGYKMSEGSMTTFAKVGSARAEKLDSLMQAWLLDFLVNPSANAQAWIEMKTT